MGALLDNGMNGQWAKSICRQTKPHSNPRPLLLLITSQPNNQPLRLSLSVEQTSDLVLRLGSPSTQGPSRFARVISSLSLLSFSPNSYAKPSILVRKQQSSKKNKIERKEQVHLGWVRRKVLSRVRPFSGVRESSPLRYG